MNTELANFAERFGSLPPGSPNAFDSSAVELFALQFKYNPAYRRICQMRGLSPQNVRHWAEAPFVPAASFKELELSCIPREKQTAVFHSSGTTEQKPSRHFHCAESLKTYERSLWTAFQENVAGGATNYDLVVLTPPPRLVPHSSLVHMFETVRRKLAAPETVFVGCLGPAGEWVVDFDAALSALGGADLADRNARQRLSYPFMGAMCDSWIVEKLQKPKLILGTAFSFVHLLDFLAANELRLKLPERSRIMETGGYKNRSRTLPKTQLHSLITRHLGMPAEEIICEYGMSELSSQAYDTGAQGGVFHFPPWARAQIISPETGREVADGETGIIRIFDLANVFSVAAIETEDLAVRCGTRFQLIGRAALAEPRGCSLATA